MSDDLVSLLLDLTPWQKRIAAAVLFDRHPVIVPVPFRSGLHAWQEAMRAAETAARETDGGSVTSG